MNDRLTAEQWSRYWRKGLVTTFQGRFKDNYDGPIREFWEVLFERLPNGAVVVDLATGNGALALLASQFSRYHKKPLRIFGIDYAAIDPARELKSPGYAALLRNVRFLPRTPLEETGLPKGQIDAAISQFGFEYGQREKSLAEVDRILKPRGAIFAAMMHHQDSAIIRQAKDGLEQIRLCEKSGLHRLVRDLVKRLDRLETLGKSPHQDDKAEALRAEINDVTGALEEAAGRFSDPGQINFYLQNSMLPFNPEYQPDRPRGAKTAVLRDVAAESTAYSQRMRDLISSAQSDAEIETLIRSLERAGFTVEHSAPFEFEGTHFAHTLIAAR